jgi:hypothetical protein
MYINEFLRRIFEFGLDAMFEEFVAAGVSTELDPIRIGYEGIAVFGENSEFPPSQEGIDLLILTAFQQPNVATLLSMLQALPAESPFSATSSVQYIQGMQLSVPARTKHDDSGSSSISTATAVAIVGAFVLAFLLAGFILRRRLRAQDPLKKYLPAPREVRAGDIEDLEAEESHCTSSVGLPVVSESYCTSSVGPASEYYCTSSVGATSESHCTSSVGAASDAQGYFLRNDEETRAAFAPESDASRMSRECDSVLKNPLLQSLRRKYKAVPRKPRIGQDNDTHGSYTTHLTVSTTGTQSCGVYQRSLSNEEETEIDFLPDSESRSISSDCDDNLFKTPFKFLIGHDTQSNKARHHETEMTTGLLPASRCEL